MTTVKPHLSGSRNLIYRDILFLLQPPLLVHSDIVTVSRCFICRSFIMSIFLHTFVCISIFIFHHEKPNKFTQFANTLQLMYITITICQHTTRVMETHHETVGGSGESLQIPINDVLTFQGRPDK